MTKNNLRKNISQGIWDQKTQEDTLKLSVLLALIALTGLFSASPVGFLVALVCGFFSYAGIRYGLGK